MKKPLLLIMAGGLFFTTGYFLGSHQSSGKSTNPDRRHAISNRGKKAANPSLIERTGTRTPTGTDHDLLYRFFELGYEDAATDLRQAIATARTFRNPAQFSRYLEGLVQVYARQDPEGALTFLAELEKSIIREAAIEDALMIYGEKTPAAALEWASENLRGQALIDATIAVAETTTNPQGAAEWLTREKGGYATLAALDFLAVAWGRNDPTSALRFFEGVADPEQSTLGLSATLAGWATHSPHEAVAWAVQATDRSALGTELFQSAFAEWVASDPQAAADFTARFEHESLQAAAVIHLGQTWPTIAPSEARKWIEGADEAIRKTGLGSFLSGWGTVDPGSAFDWGIANLEVDGPNLQELVLLGEDYIAEDRQQFEAKLATLPRGPARELMEEIKQAHESLAE